MSLSKNVKENLEEAQSYLRAALANAARSEKSNIAHGISELVVGIDRIVKMEEFSDKIDEITEKMKKDGGGGNGSSFFGGLF
jgi:nanoRNase/pAp phosphatase (c-di-AMP/oligoRNAs hydrolase)